MHALRASTALAAALLLGSASQAAAAGYWRLDHVEFRNAAGADQWTGQSEWQITLLHHDNDQLAFRQVWRGDTSETYSVDWHIPDALIPGQVPSLALSETCAQSALGSGYPFPSNAMAPASLVADFNHDAALQLASPACTPGATVEAGPPLTWKVPAGKPGDTTTIKASAGPTYYHSVDVVWVFHWLDGATPPATAPTGEPHQASGRAHGQSTAPAGEPHATSGHAHGPEIAGPASTWRIPPGTTGAEPLTSPSEPVIFRNGADGAVSPGPTAPTIFQANGPVLITQIMTYHYGARGAPGTIALRHADGTVYGPWPAAGAGSPALRNAYWWVRPNVVLKPGAYTVIDSEPATWSVEAATQGAGIVQLWGRAP